MDEYSAYVTALVPYIIKEEMLMLQSDDESQEKWFQLTPLEQSPSSKN
eukprot:gene33364-44669_t